MLRLAQEMVNEASTLFWGGEQTPEQRTALYAKDVEVNKLERAIRKHIIAHLSDPVPSDVPYCLLIMSLVKDLERLGDYAKNLSELVSIADAPFPDDANLGELREIARSVERLASEAGRVFANADRDRAKELTIEAAPWPSAARTTSTPRAKRTQHTSRRHIVRGIARGVSTPRLAPARGPPYFTSPAVRRRSGEPVQPELFDAH
jgi:phosphate uptake regulator